MTRPTFAEFKEKALANSEVRKEYEALSLAYDIRKKLITLRKKEAGLTQEELAASLHKQKSNISHLDNWVHFNYSFVGTGLWLWKVRYYRTYLKTHKTFKEWCKDLGTL